LRCLAAVLLLATACASGIPQEGRAGWPWTGESLRPAAGDDLGARAAELLSQAIRFETVIPPGGERPLAEHLVAYARQEGLEARVIETPAGPGGSPRAAAWAVLPGRGRARPIVLLSHLDVVPADPEQWTVPPFEGVVAAGFVVGRGALDAKGIAVVHLLALVELARRGVELDRDVVFLAVPDEETGGRLGAGVITRDHRELLGGAEFLLAEGGGIQPSRSSGPDVWGVTFTEKTPCWIELRTQGAAGHTASPGADDAVGRLVRALERVRELEFEVRVVPEVARMFEALAPLASPEDRASFANLAEALAWNPGFRARFLAERGQAALVRNTVAITVLEGSATTNMTPARARAHLDGRLLPGERCGDFVEQIRAVIDDPAVSLDILLSFPGNASPVDTDLFRAIERVAARRDPQALVVPRVISGFTDAHYFRQLGIVAYGFVPRRLRPLDTRGIHGPNERISIANLVLGVETMVELLLELAGRPSS
jgi:acetylornithine deacetylase/succinyl-diaminopimelate desuccinylase-like protein